jgi:hypothetical protein
MSDLPALRPLGLQRFCLPLLGVRLECLDRNLHAIRGTVASGFVRKEGGQFFLYTCWHVVTGIDPHHVVVPPEHPNRRFLQVLLQAADKSHPGLVRIGGAQSHIVPLYADPIATSIPLEPLWYQDARHIPNRYLNLAGLFVPSRNDIVKIRLPDGLCLSGSQVVDTESEMPLSAELPAPGDKCLIVGYPYGFSAAGMAQPTPVVFTRFIASNHIAGPRRFEFFLDGFGAPSMSGGPVFVERGERLYLLGVYSGDIYPDHELHTREKTTALGTVADIRLIVWHPAELSRTPTVALNADGTQLDTRE